MTSASQQLGGLRARLRSREPLIGGFLDLGSPVSAEIVARAGFDFVVIDLEHSAGDPAAARTQIAAAERHAEVIVRVPDIAADPGAMLDFGAAGVLFPRGVASTQADAAAAATRYARGRGVSPFARSAAFGAGGPAWKEEADASVVCIVQIERAAALDAVDDILALEDVDAVYVGPADLSNDLGCQADLARGPVRDAALLVADAARRAGKAAGIHVPSPAAAQEWLEQGYTLVSASFESQFLRLGAARAADELRALI